MKTTILTFSLCLAFLFVTSIHGQDWPQINGPNGDASYRLANGAKAATETKHLRHIWDSAIQVAAPGLSRQEMPNGGCATPIIQDEKMYIWWVSPDLDAPKASYHRAPRKARGEFLQNYHMFRVVDWTLWGKENIACIDIKTGKTIWWRTFNSQSPIYGAHKDSINNHTMAAADGRVYAKGSDHYLYCLDGKTGALLWRVPSFSLRGRIEFHFHAMSKMVRPARNRSDNNYLIVVDGVVIDSGYTVAGYDAKTGEKLWQSKDVKMTPRQSAKVFKHKGSDYVIAPGIKQATLIDPKTGKTLWQLSELGFYGATLSVQGEYLFVNHLNEGEDRAVESQSGQTACYKISPEKAELLWVNKDVPFASANNHAVYVHNGNAFVNAGTHVMVLKLTDGSLVKSIPIEDGKQGGNTGITMRVNDYMYISRDSQHLHYNFRVFDMNTLERVGRVGMYYPGISYSSHMLPVFHGESVYIRRNYGRISKMTFTSHDAPDVDVQLAKPIYVAAKGESIALKANVAGKGVESVEYLLDDKPVGKADKAPYEVKIKADQLGSKQLQAVAISGGQRIESYKRLLDVVEVEIRLLSITNELRVGDKRRFIPIALHKGREWMLPQKFQTVRLSETLSNDYPNAFERPTPEQLDEWHGRSQLTASKGKIDKAKGSGKKLYGTWGTYISEEAGEDVIKAAYELNGFKMSAEAKVTILPKDAKRTQRIWRYDYPATATAVKKIRLKAANEAGPQGMVVEVVEGKDLVVSNKMMIIRLQENKTGLLKLRMYHPGNEIYKASEPVEFSIFVHNNKSRKPLIISFDAIADQSKATKEVVLSAKTASKNPVSYQVLSGPAKVNGATLLLTGQPGVVTVVCEHGGDGEYLKAQPVVREFRVK